MLFSAIQYRGQNKRPLRTLKIEYWQEEMPLTHIFMRAGGSFSLCWS